MIISKFELAVGQKIAAGATNYELLVYAKILELLKNGAVFVVSTYSLLPSAVGRNGQLYFIETGEDLVYSDGTTWKNILKSESQLWSWGPNAGGNLGDGTVTNKCSPVREISFSTDWCQVSSSAGQFAAAVKSSGQLWSWGSNITGRLGDGTQTSRCSPVREISFSTDWCQVGTGEQQSSAIKTSGQLWSWGSNECGRLGDGTTVDKCSPVREITSSTDWCQVSNRVAIKTSGQLWSWGSNVQGRLGDGTTVGKCSPVREISSSTDWCQVSSQNVNTVAVKTSGQIWVWGYGYGGRLGDGTTVSKCSPVREITSSTDWCQAVSVAYHTAAVKTSGQLWSWGSGNNGVLGDGTTISKCSPVREFCSATDWCEVTGNRTTFGIKTSGQLWGWAYNGSGNIGDGTTVNKCSPVREISSSTNWCQVSAGSATIALKLKPL